MVKKVKPGQKAEIRIESYPGHVLRGTVLTVATMASSDGWFDRSVKEYETMVKVEDVPPDAGLKPGFTGEVKVLIDNLTDVLVVPVQAVGQKDAQHRCYVVRGSGVEAREITLGDSNEKFVVVAAGLTEGEKVVLDARARIVAARKGGGEKCPKSPQST